MQRFHSGMKELENKLGYQFQEQSLLLEALTHSTYAYETQDSQITDNERLEFLGDAVLDLVISDKLFHLERPQSEGWMSKTRALVVCENTLADLGQQLEIGQLLLLGKGEDLTGGREKASNISNAVEAVFGAIYLDGGYTPARKTILDGLDKFIEQAIAGNLIFDYKSRLLELAQSRQDLDGIRFEIVDEAGPVHLRTFTAAVMIHGAEISRGKGSSKKEAEQSAAKQAYKKLI